VFTDDWDCVSRLAQRHGDPWFWQHLLAFAAALWRREGRLPSSPQQESESENESEATKKTKAGAKNESDSKAQGKKGILLEDVVAHMIKALGPIPAFEMIAASGSDDVGELATVFPPVAYRHFVHAVNVDIQHKELVYWMVRTHTHTHTHTHTRTHAQHTLAHSRLVLNS
jgi:anaerobic selenocysteine-containing dehydrogenase